MASIKQVAMPFFEACETGKGWEGCKAYCTPDATFSAQAEPLADVRPLQAYADWMQGTVKMPVGGGPPSPVCVPRTSSDDVYSMDFDGDSPLLFA